MIYRMQSSPLSSVSRSSASRASSRPIDALLDQKRPTLVAAANIFLLCLLGMNGIWAIVPGTYLETASHISIAVFWACSLAAFLRIRGRVPWSLWTCRFAFIFLCWILLSISWSTQPLSTTYSPAISSICVFFYYCYIMDRFTPSEFKTLLFQMFTVMFIICVLMIIFMPYRGLENAAVLGTNPDNAGDWKGVYRQKNELGLNCGIAFGLCIGYAPKNALERIWRDALTVLTVVLSYGSRSRESWIAIALVIFLSALIKPFRRFDPRSRFPAFVVVFFVLVVSVTLISLNLDVALHLIGRDRTFTGRSSIWEWSMMAAQRRPWFGYGIYGFWKTPLANDVIVRAGWQVTSSHNSYLDVVISYGIIGLLLYLPIPLFAVIYIFRAVMSYSLEIFEMFIYMLVAIIVISFAGGFLTYAIGIGYVLAIYTISNLEKVERSGFMRLDT